MRSASDDGKPCITCLDVPAVGSINKELIAGWVDTTLRNVSQNGAAKTKTYIPKGCSGYSRERRCGESTQDRVRLVDGLDRSDCRSRIK